MHMNDFPALDQIEPKLRRRRSAEDEADRRSRRDLASALGRGGFVLHYQPRVVLANGRQSGLEALLRWPSRTHGMLTPRGFMPMAAEAGLVGAIGGWTLRAACLAAASWRSGLAVAVSISPEQMSEGLLADQIAAALEESGLAAESLELELSEAVALEQDAETLLVLAGLRDLGVGLVLDDFGALHGSLSALRRLPLTAVKLDGSLVRGVPEDREDTAVVRLTVEMARTLSLLVIAEGIETEAQRQCLAAMGCQEGQGYLFGAPLPAERLGV